MYHEQQGVLKHHQTMVGEEHRAFGCRLDVVENLAVVGIDDVGERHAWSDTAPCVNQAIEDTRVTGFDVLEFRLVDEDGLVGCAEGSAIDDTRPIHHPEYGVDGLAAGVQVYPVGLSA